MIKVRKKVVILLLLINMLFTTGMSFAYWASSISINNTSGNGNVDIGDWFDGYIPIFNEQEFIQVITTNQNTNSYILARDLDFEFVLPEDWIQTKDIIFNGLLEGNNKTISNIELIDYRGIFGILEGATVRNLNLDSININYSESNTYTSGILAGRLQGTGNLIENVHISNSSINNESVLSGGLIGFASPVSGTGTAIIRDISIIETTISGGYVGATYGNGGVIASVNNFNIEFENISVDVSVTSPNATNVGGIVGATIGTSTLSFTEVYVNNSNIQLNAAGAALGAGGIVGYLTGQNHTMNDIHVTNSTITSQSSSGGLIGYATQTSTTLLIDNFEATGNTISSSLASATAGNGGVIGTLIGYNATISNGLVSADVTSTATTNAGGIVGYSDVSAKLNFTDLTVDSSNININGSNTALGAGGTVGLALGFGHEFLRIRVFDTNVTGSNSTGGLFGRFNGSSGISNFNNIKVKGININSTLTNITISAGGMVGYIQGSSTDLRFFDIYVEGIIQSNVANVGGLVGYTASNTIVRVSRIVIFADLIVNSPGSVSNTGAGGIVGRHTGSTFQVTDAFYTGNLKARIAQSRPYSGIARSIGTSVTINNMRSADVSYWTTGTTYQLINSSTLYGRLRGQSPGYTFHTNLRTSLDNAYWTTNFATFSTSIWTYNTTTRLYELNN